MHVGGDNIINAIYNAATNKDILLKNITYTHSDGSSITTGNAYESPVNGAENSQGGTLVYQDDREYLQNITIQVQHEDGDIIYYTPEALPTNIFGNVNVTLTKPLRKGYYYVDAVHSEDWNYKVISNSSGFRVLGLVDLSTDKTSDKNETFQDEIINWNVTAHNADNGTYADNVTITDHLPNVFNLTDLNYTFFNSSGDIWTNGSLNLKNSTLNYAVYDENSGSWIYGEAKYDESSKTWTYYVLYLEDNTLAYNEFVASDFTSLFGPVISDNELNTCYRNISYDKVAQTWYYYNLTIAEDTSIIYGDFNPGYFTDVFGVASYDSENAIWTFNRTVSDETGRSSIILTYYNETGKYWLINDTIVHPYREVETKKGQFNCR